MPANLFDPTAVNRAGPEVPLRFTTQAVARLNQPRDGVSGPARFRELIAAPMTLVVQVKGGPDLAAHLDGEVFEQEEGIGWQQSAPVVLSVPAVNHGSVTGLSVYNADGLAIAGLRYKPALPLPRGGDARTVTVDELALVMEVDAGADRRPG